MSVEDRLAIQDVIARYADLVDGGRFDALEEVFTVDATIDYSAFAGPIGGIDDAKRFLSESLPAFRRTQHMMGLPVVRLDGDTATARTPCHNPMVIDDADGTTAVWLIGLWYDDELVRTPGGWRINRRRAERCYFLTGHTDAPAT